VVGQQGLDRAAQQGGEMAAHRRHDQHFWIASCGVAMEAHELAERLAQQDLFVDRRGLVADLRRLQAELGLAVVLGEPRHDLRARRHRLAEPGAGKRVVGAGIDLLQRVGPKADGLGELTLELIRGVKHGARIVRAPGGLSLQ